MKKNCKDCGRELHQKELEMLRAALEDIRSKTCVMGYDSGDTAVHKIATDALGGYYECPEKS